MASSSKSIVRNALFGFSTWVLPLLVSFIATPIIVSSLGNKDYGIYALVIGFVGYSFNFGVGRSITKFLAQHRADGTPQKATRIISATLTLNLLVGVGGCLILVFLANWLVNSVFVIEEASRQTSVYAFYIAGLIIFMTMMNQVGTSVLQGVHRFDVFSRLFNANSIAIIIGNAVLAILGFGLLSLLWWNLFALTLTSIAGIIFAKKHVPEFRLQLDFSKSALKATLGFSMWIIGYQILGNVLLLFERGWIMRKLGTEALTFYVVPLTIGFYIHSFISSLALVIFPLASEHKGDRAKLQRLYQKATKITCMFVFFIVLSFAVVSRQFLEIWMGPEFAQNSGTLLIIHALSFGSLSLLIVSWQMADGLGHPGYNFLILLVCVAVSVTGMILTIDSLQNEGIAYSRLAGFGLMIFSIIYSEHWFFGRFDINYWVRLLMVLLPATAAAAFTEYLLIVNFDGSWFTLIATASAGGAVYLFILFVLGFITEDEKALIRKAFKT